MIRQRVRSVDDLPALSPLFHVFHNGMLGAMRETSDLPDTRPAPSPRRLLGTTFFITTVPGTSTAAVDISHLYVMLHALRVDNLVYKHPWTGRGDPSGAAGVWPQFMLPLTQALLSHVENPPRIFTYDDVAKDTQFDTLVSIVMETGYMATSWFANLPSVCFRDLIRSGAGLAPYQPPGRSLLYIRRTHYRTIADELVFQSRLEEFARAERLDFRVHDSGSSSSIVTLNLTTQLELAGGAGVVIGLHGAGTFWCSLAPYGAINIEMQPLHKHWDYYEQLCAMSGVQAVTWRLPADSCVSMDGPTNCKSSIDFDVLQREYLDPAARHLRNHRQGSDAEVNRRARRRLGSGEDSIHGNDGGGSSGGNL